MVATETSRAVGRREADSIPAVTPEGRGTITPFHKATSHLLLVYTAITDKYPMTMKDAAKELTEAFLHVKAISWPEELLTKATIKQGEKWATAVGKVTDVFNTSAAQSTDKATAHSTVTDTQTASLKALITDSWQLVARFDLELTGLSVRDVDPGTAR